MKYILTVTGLLFSLFHIHSQSYYNYNTSSGSGFTQEGNAVYYADYMHGKRTAMGEVYRREEFTAAHKTLPGGTLVRVTRLDNGQSVVVRINDRGPFKKNRIIDLSRAAAMKIGLVRKGRARVRLENVGRSNTNPVNGVLPGEAPPPNPYSNMGYSSKGATAQPPKAPSNYSYGSAPAPTGYNYANTTVRGNMEPYPSLPPSASGYGIQLASYTNLNNARNQLRQLENQGIQNLYLWQKGGYYKIVIASFASKNAAAAYLDQLKRQHLQDGLVVKLR